MIEGNTHTHKHIHIHNVRCCSERRRATQTFPLFSHCSHTVLTLFSHCSYTVLTLFLHCFYTVLTLFLRCSQVLSRERNVTRKEEENQERLQKGLVHTHTHTHTHTHKCKLCVHACI
jgi:Ca2+/Na+ antiporter